MFLTLNLALLQLFASLPTYLFVRLNWWAYYDCEHLLDSGSQGFEASSLATLIIATFL